MEHYLALQGKFAVFIELTFASSTEVHPVHNMNEICLIEEVADITLSFGKMEWNKCNFENILLKTELLF
jgi:hypothetical protein